MNQGPLVFLGVFLSLTLSWLGMIVAPSIQLGQVEAASADVPGGLYPTPRPGQAQQGAEVYRANGCYQCHTLQARAEGVGADFNRGWGKRFTVARDYMFDQPVMLGSQRVGPDLANISARQTNSVWHLTHLYNPQLTSPGSTMPPYPFLFQKQPVNGRPSPDALVLPAGAGVEPGFEVVPTKRALALVAYMQSLRAEIPLDEAPIPAPPKAAGGTNSPTADSGTNKTASPSAQK